MYKCIELEPNNPRWYFFICKEMQSLNIKESIIKEYAENGLNKKSSHSFYKIGPISILLSLNTLSEDEFNHWYSYAIDIDSNLLDLYYYKLQKDVLQNIDYLLFLNQKSIDDISKLENNHSFINSNGDHLFFLWGLIYLNIDDYERAKLMWGKIHSQEYLIEISKILDEKIHNIDVIKNEIFSK